MKNRRLLVLLIFSTILNLCLLPIINAQSKSNSILSKMEASTKTIKTLYADLRHEKQNKQIGGREVYEGKMYLKRIRSGWDRGRIDYENKRTLLFDDGKITFEYPRFIPASPIIRIEPITTDEELEFFARQFSSTTQGIMRLYYVTYFGDEVLGDTTHSILVLTPKRESEIRRIKWWINNKTWLPSRVELINEGGDCTVLTLTNDKRDIRMDEDVLNPPRVLRVTRVRLQRPNGRPNKGMHLRFCANRKTTSDVKC